MDISGKIAEELKIKKWQVEAVEKLIEEGCTIPFIARYRKEQHGSLDDEQLRSLDERLNYLRNLEERKETVLAGISEQGKLTDELRQKILDAETQVALEDLYRPYRPKRRTRATIAREKGLEGLADILLLQDTKRSLEEEAEAYVDADKEVVDTTSAIQGAMDILAESFSDDADYRMAIRRRTMERGVLISQAKDKEEKTVYENYYDFDSPLKKLSGYQILAVNRGEKEKVLHVSIEAPEDEILRYMKKKIITHDNPHTTPWLEKAIEDSYKRLIAPAVEREIRNSLTEEAEDGAIRVFGKNLQQLLMQPPIAGHVVLGWDPAFRTGCKLAVVDETGKVLDTVVVYPTEPQKKIEETKRIVKGFIEKYNIRAEKRGFDCEKAPGPVSGAGKN